MRIFALAIAGVAALAPAASQVRAQPADRHDETAADWAWSQIRNGLPADFRSRPECQETQFDPGERHKKDVCRLLYAGAISNMLIKKERLKQLGQHGVRIIGAWIVGNIDLADTEIVPVLLLSDSRLDGDLMLNDSHVKRLISIEGSHINGGFSASRMHDDTAIRLIGDTFTKRVALDGARIGGDLSIDRSNFENGINAQGVDVAGSLDVEHSRVHGMNADLSEIQGAVFLDEIIAYRLNTSGDVHLINARMGTLQITNALFLERFSINSSEIRDNVLIDQSTFQNDVDMTVSKIGGATQITRSSFYGVLHAGRTNIGGSVLVQDVRFWDEFKFSGAKIGSFLKLDHVSAAEVDLSEGNAGQLVLSDVRWWCAGARPPDAAPVYDGSWGAWMEVDAALGPLALADIRRWDQRTKAPGVDDATPTDDVSLAWEQPHGGVWPLGEQVNASCDTKEPPKLVLRAFHVADFQGDENTWPPAMDFQGFQYDRLGSLAGDPGGEVREPSRDRWKDWLLRDLTFHAQPYIELSSVLGAAGDGEAADAVQLMLRDLQLNEMCSNWRQTGACLGSSLLSLFTGYGIESYAYRIVIGVFAFTGLGTLVLWFSPNACRHRLLWRAGASLHQLLPVIDLSKEFKDFFENPAPQFDEEPNLTRWQVGYFAVHAIAGWVLGFFLLAAMGGLIQKS